MRFLTRTLLAWLLMLAIPVQGFAATAMLLCASGHQSKAHAAAQSNHAQHQASHGSAHAGHDQAHSTHAGAGASIHAGAGASIHADAGATIHADAGATSHAHAPDKGKCSACASCCVGTALVAAPFVNPVAPQGNVAIAFTLAVFASYVPERLDPPPRSFLA
jgi:hypothetical protein